MDDLTTDRLCNESFDPRAWLADFEKIGGGFITPPDRAPMICQMIEGRSREDQRAASRMMGALTDDQRAALRAHITEHAAAERLWSERLRAVEEANRVPTDYDRQVWDPLYALQKTTGAKVPAEIVDRQEALSDAHWEARNALMETPAPTLSALRWKLDLVFAVEPGDDSHDAWSVDFLAQTIADYRRLLADA